MGVVDVDVPVSSHIKEELAWSVGKQLQVISTKLIVKNSKSTTELKGKSHFKFEKILYTLLCDPF